MNTFNATMIVDGEFELAGIDPDETDPIDLQETYIEAAQHLIDTGLAWSLQGSIGRTCQRLIEEGYCHDQV